MSIGVFLVGGERERINKIQRQKKKRRGLEKMDSRGRAAEIGHACP